MGIKDDYTAFCFDEACGYILLQLKQDKKPMFKSEQNFVKRYSSPLDMYREMEIEV